MMLIFKRIGIPDIAQSLLSKDELTKKKDETGLL
jgi:hypothetical protein